MNMTMRKSNYNFVLVCVWLLGVSLTGINLGIYFIGTEMIEKQSRAAFYTQNVDAVCLEWKTPIQCRHWVSRQQYLMVIDDHFGRLDLENNDEK